MKKQNQNAQLGRLLQQIGGAIQKHTNPRPPKSFFAHGPGKPKNRGRLPEWFKRLDVKCSGNHFAPVPCNFTGFGKSEKEAPVAKYRCPVCGRTHNMARNAQGQAFCLYTKG